MSRSKMSQFREGGSNANIIFSYSISEMLKKADKAERDTRKRTNSACGL